MTFELTQAIARHGLKLNEAMNLLQEHSVISDNAVDLEDVGAADSATAVYWLDRNPFLVDEKIMSRATSK